MPATVAVHNPMRLASDVFVGALSDDASDGTEDGVSEGAPEGAVGKKVSWEVARARRAARTIERNIMFACCKFSGGDEGVSTRGRTKIKWLGGCNKEKRRAYEIF